MLEIPISIAASALSKAAADVIYDAIKERLIEKGASKEDIKKLDEFEREKPDELEVKEFISNVEGISSSISFDDKLYISTNVLSEAHGATKTLRSERMRQASLAFNAAIVLLVLGVIIILTGVALMLLKDATTGGAVTTAVGAVVEVISALLFKFSNDAQNRLDEVGRHLNAIEAAQVAVTLIGRIEDPAKRDDAVREAAYLLAGLGSAVPKKTLT